MLQQNFHTLQNALAGKFGNAVFNFSETANATFFCVKPSHQVALFNFLVYDDDWKFTQLKDMTLAYSPDSSLCPYHIEYLVKSTNYNQPLKINIPVSFTNGKANTLADLYKTAAKYEKVISDLYNISFCPTKQKLPDFFENSKSIEKAVPVQVSAWNDDAVLSGGNEHFFAGATGYATEEKTVATIAAAIPLSKPIDTSFYGKTRALTESEREPQEGIFSSATSKFKKPDVYRLLMLLLPLLLIGGIIAMVKISGTSQPKSSFVAATASEPQKPITGLPEQTNEYRTVAFTGTDNKLNNIPLTLSQAEKNILLKNAAASKIKKELPDAKKTGEEIKNNAPEKNSLTRLGARAAEPESLLTAISSTGAKTAPVQTIAPLTIARANKTADENALQKPGFPGGLEAMRKYFNNRLHMTDEAVENGLQGSVVAKFAVDTKGNISAITLSKKVGYGCDEVIERFIKSMPRWIPGKQEGENQTMDVSIRILFEPSSNGTTTLQ